MAKIIKVDAYDIITSKTVARHINADNVIEVEELLPTGGKPLTRVKMSDGTLIDIEKSVDDVTKLINA
jgi:hypothetical protein